MPPFLQQKYESILEDPLDEPAPKRARHYNTLGPTTNNNCANLMESVIAGDSGRVQKELEQYSFTARHKIFDKQGVTLLQQAIIFNNNDVALYLLNNMAFPEVLQTLDKDKNTPLHSAVKYNRSKVVEAILDLAWKKYMTPDFLLSLLKARNKYGNTPLHR